MGGGREGSEVHLLVNKKKSFFCELVILKYVYTLDCLKPPLNFAPSKLRVSVG